MLLRRHPLGNLTVVGKCFLYGLDDANGLLGPLPQPWRWQVSHDSIGLLSIYRCFNPETNVLSDGDPRLASLSESEWARVEVEMTGDDPETFQTFRNKVTGQVLKSDPRLRPEALKARGSSWRHLH
jgi:hypothetical protein